MPVSVVVGGQFGSEGKGKVALEIARRSDHPVAVVRVGGPNSGHTAYDRTGRKRVLRQLPAGCIDRDVDVVLPAGSYIDVGVLKSELEELDYPQDRIRISGQARIITDEHKQWEAESGLAGAIGSTGSGVGGAVMASVARGAGNFELESFEAADHADLEPFICDTSVACGRPQYGRPYGRVSCPICTLSMQLIRAVGGVKYMIPLFVILVGTHDFGCRRRFLVRFQDTIGPRVGYRERT